MTRMTRMVCTAWLLASSGCAGMSSAEMGDVVFVVETGQDLGRMVFGAERGVPFELAVAGEGATVYRQRTRAGMYCLQEVTTGDLNVGYSIPVPSPICVRVEPGVAVYGGHLVLRRDGVRRTHDRARLDAQLGDESVEVVTSPAWLVEKPFDLEPS
ncbi:MAG: hypothetical protein KUG77_28360 [Nannocystaceae bacterium]|nr:hypothetical protein [Nannocystaceae bacterium]